MVQPLIVRTEDVRVLNVVWELVMKTGVFVLPATAFALLIATVAIADAPEEDIWAECRSTDSCTIEYDHLADQKSDPFLFNGKEMDREHPQWQKYRRNLRRYSDVRDCLISSEAKRETPNLVLIDWNKMRSQEIIEVCMHRIFSSLGSPDAAKQWFEIQGLQNVVLRVESGSVASGGRRVPRRVTIVSAGNLLSESGECYKSGGFLSSKLCAKLVHGESFFAEWDEHNQLWNTAYSQTVK